MLTGLKFVLLHPWCPYRASLFYEPNHHLDFSIFHSLGNAAVFLIGGLTRETEPVPILLRSGDIVIMSGPACRRAFHGVPRILEGSLPRHLTADAVVEKGAREEWRPYEEYLGTSRININVRQVFPKGFDPYAESAESA